MVDAGLGQYASINWAATAKVDALGEIAKDLMSSNKDSQKQADDKQQAEDNAGGLWYGLKKIGEAIGGAIDGYSNAMKSLRGSIAGGIQMLGNGIAGNGFYTNDELTSIAAQQQAAKQDLYNKAFRIQDLNAAKNLASTGAYYKGDLQSSMVWY